MQMEAALHLAVVAPEDTWDQWLRRHGRPAKYQKQEQRYRPHQNPHLAERQRQKLENLKGAYQDQTS